MKSFVPSLFLLLRITFFSALLQGQTLNPEHLRGLSMRSIGPAAMSGRITALTVDPNNR